MKAIDVHSHWATEKGYLYKGAEVPAAEDTYRMKITYRTGEEMAEGLRALDCFNHQLNLQLRVGHPPPHFYPDLLRNW